MLNEKVNTKKSRAQRLVNMHNRTVPSQEIREMLKEQIRHKFDGSMKAASIKCDINYTNLSAIKNGLRIPGKTDRIKIEKGLGIPASCWPEVGADA